MNKTKIEWCDSTWNPVTGCLHGCEYCYARKIANRFGWHAIEPNIYERVLVCPAVSAGKKVPYPFDFAPTFHAYRLDEPQKWEKPRTIFVCSMADLFGEWVPDKWIEAVFEACEKAPQHRYLFLTKNPWRYVKLADKEKLPVGDNMWYGTSLVSHIDIKSILDSFRLLGSTFNTFLSVEPLLEDISYTEAWIESIYGNRIDWVIIGAETGNRKNKIVPQKEWIINIAENCDYTYTPVFMKDSLIPIVGEENMRREFPWLGGKNERI